MSASWPSRLMTTSKSLKLQVCFSRSSGYSKGLVHPESSSNSLFVESRWRAFGKPHCSGIAQVAEVCLPCKTSGTYCPPPDFQVSRSDLCFCFSFVSESVISMVLQARQSIFCKIYLLAWNAHFTWCESWGFHPRRVSVGPICSYHWLHYSIQILYREYPM